MSINHRSMYESCVSSLYESHSLYRMWRIRWRDQIELEYSQVSNPYKKGVKPYVIIYNNEFRRNHLNHRCLDYTLLLVYVHSKTCSNHQFLSEPRFESPHHKKRKIKYK